MSLETRLTGNPSVGAQRPSGGASSRPCYAVLTAVISILWLSLAQAEDIPLSPPIPSTIHEIELTYAGNSTDPAVAFSGPVPPAGPLPYRPFLPILELLPGFGAAHVFGPCHGQAVRSDSRLEWSGLPGTPDVVVSVSSCVLPEGRWISCPTRCCGFWASHRPGGGSHRRSGRSSAGAQPVAGNSDGDI